MGTGVVLFGAAPAGIFSHLIGVGGGWGEVCRHVEGKGDDLGRYVVAIARKSPYLPSFRKKQERY